MIAEDSERRIERFARIDRLAHAGLIVSFLGLSITGLPLLFSHTEWAQWLSRYLGGYATTGVLHRVFAVSLIAVFAGHVVRIFRRAVLKGDRSLLWGPDSLVPQPRDLIQLIQHLRYFAGRGPRPQFDHFAYWEKFDYWAVFWGMFVIGGSGLLLWFPLFFSLFLPGWIFNLATIVHGEEALLATGFIFMIHFFNENLRPSRFPMNNVMFQGGLTEEELEEERPAEYARYKAAGGRGWREAEPIPAPALRAWRIFGGIGLIIGTSLLIAIVVGILAH
jgi:cytochrome b subunit of formate dehydrogenase